MKKLLSIILVFGLLVSLCACGNKSASYSLKFSTKEKNIISSFAADDSSQTISLSQTEKEKTESFIDSVSVNFPYSDLFQTEECYKRLKTDTDVSKHNYCALNGSNVLDANCLLETVKQNNNDYLAAQKYGLVGVEAPEDDYTLEICKLIVDTITALKNKIPDIDYDRVYCNLGNLKILYKNGMVDYAQVTSDIVMYISPTMFEIAEQMNGDDVCRNVVVHEIMHLVQIGCSCEAIENCTRRCGISYNWTDFQLNTTDFSWLFEGSAERSMCNLIGAEPTTYTNMINYICTLNMATMLNKDVAANYAETISFYDNSDKLFKIFDCNSQEDEYEILNMMIATNIILTTPDEFMSVYAENTGEGIEDDDAIDNLNYTLKPAVCLVLTKNFYKNLSQVLVDNNNITLNDLCYTVALFEASIDSHLKFSKEELNGYNLVFISKYKDIRNQLFDSINNSCGIDVNSYYSSYSIYLDTDKNIVNASMKWNTADKNFFYLERTDYLEYNIDSKVS